MHAPAPKNKCWGKKATTTNKQKLAEGTWCFATPLLGKYFWEIFEEKLKLNGVLVILGRKACLLDPVLPCLSLYHLSPDVSLSSRRGSMVA